ncbi:hypothetical protein JS562_53010, partial [Agrobacterium sp. S2]|nr:hypothetical protein [Agrobacterium sp. S2]
DDSVLASMSRYIRPNATALVVDLEEINPDVVNSLVQQTGGKLVRRSYDDVLAEIMSAEAAAEAAVDAAAQKIRDEKRAERKAEREAKWEKTKEKFKSFFTKHSS